MKNPFTPKEEEPIDAIVAEAITDLGSYDIADEDFARHAKNVQTLQEIQKANKPESAISKETLVKFLLLGGLTTAQIVLMLYFEKAGVITSKALGFLQKIKVPSLL